MHPGSMHLQQLPGTLRQSCCVVVSRALAGQFRQVILSECAQVRGLCLGLLIGTAVHFVLLSVLWLRTDWQVS